MKFNDPELRKQAKSLYRFFRELDVPDPSEPHSEDDSSMLISYTEVFLLDVVSILLSTARRPRFVLRKLSWLRKMLHPYPKVRKIILLLSSSSQKVVLSVFDMDVPSSIIVFYRFRHSDLPEGKERECQPMIESLASFFRHLGNAIFDSGWGYATRREEFDRISDQMQAMVSGEYDPDASYEDENSEELLAARIKEMCNLK